MYAIGHLGFAYLATRILTRKPGLNVALILALALIPDVDYVIPFLEHRGPTHSVAVFLALFAATLALNRRYVPYSVAYASHIVADIFTGMGSGGTQLLWPFSTEFFSFQPRLVMGTAMEAYVEVSLLVAAAALLVYTKDYRGLLKPSTLNLSLFITCLGVLGSLYPGTFSCSFPRILLFSHAMVLVALSLLLAKNLLGFARLEHKPGP